MTPYTVASLAQEMHTPEARIQAAVNELAAHWGRSRVLLCLPDKFPVVLPAAVTVIRQSYGACPTTCRTYGKQGVQLRTPFRRAA